MNSKQKHIPEGIDTNNRKEVFELAVFHPQEPSMLNIFPQRIFETNNLFRSSSYQKLGLPTTYLHQVVAVPTNFCIKHLLQHKLSETNNFASELPGVHGSLGHVKIYGCCWEQLLLLTKVGRLCTLKSKFSSPPNPTPAFNVASTPCRA